MNKITQLLRLARPYRAWVTLGVVFNVLTVLFGIVSFASIIPFLQILFGLKPALERAPDWEASPSGLLGYLDWKIVELIAHQGKYQALVMVCAGVIVAFFLKNLFRYLAMAAMAPLRNGIARDLRSSLFRASLARPLTWHTREHKGDLLSRLSTDVQEVEWGVLNTLEVVAREPLAILGSLLVMVSVSPKLVLFALVMMAFTALVIGGVGKALKRQSAEAQSSLGRLLSIMEEALGGARVIKAFGAEAQQQQKFDKEGDHYRNLNTRMMWRRDLSSPLTEFLGISVMAILLWYGAGLVFDGQLQPERFIFFLMMFYNVITPAKALSSGIYNIRKGLGAWERVREVLDLPASAHEQEGIQTMQPFKETIQFGGVCFSYENASTPALRDVSLTLKKGETLALVGQSGAGKSTLADLLLRFHEPTEGTIQIDGADIHGYTLASLRSQIAVVTQEPILFHDTIRANIAFGMPHATDEQIIAAAKAANAHDFIAALPQGYQTSIGTRGSALSGGQRQRLTIARALLRNAPILVLDEATSSLDTESEQLVQAALAGLMQGRTTLVIAHRLSTIRNAHQIAVMEAGKVIELGNHETLLGMGGTYAKMVALQG